MKCSCPKCSAVLEVDLPESPVEVGGVKCSECKSKFPVRLESFATRALWKADEIWCIQCASHLGNSTFCPGCKALFPDYMVLQPAKKRDDRTLWEKIAVFEARSYKPARSLSTVSYDRPQFARKSVAKPLAVVAILLLVMALLASGGLAYRNYQKEQQYTADYIRALYGIKSGVDFTLATSTRIASEWKIAMDAGKTYTPQLKVEEETRLSSIKSKIDLLMQKTETPPIKFAAAKEKLTRLYAKYGAAQKLVFTPLGTLATFADSAGKTDRDLKQGLQEVKANMPAELAEEFKNGQAKYRNLRDM